ncbi:hypothetical protein LSTR_LSTR005149 [Laodelphax striatellus]|uniref:Uncharacterized protein n=1 Tax=Laodelphax striatellus TaxID=195883 RepID=A0A482WR11_LAOST|nr:hypothetical protein LSTR_LSTR005149 [Laodelphax striatellus]
MMSNFSAFNAPGCGDKSSAARSGCGQSQRTQCPPKPQNKCQQQNQSSKNNCPVHSAKPAASAGGDPQRQQAAPCKPCSGKEPPAAQTSDFCGTQDVAPSPCKACSSRGPSTPSSCASQNQQKYPPPASQCKQPSSCASTSSKPPSPCKQQQAKQQDNCNSCCSPPPEDDCEEEDDECDCDCEDDEETCEDEGVCDTECEDDNQACPDGVCCDCGDNLEDEDDCEGDGNDQELMTIHITQPKGDDCDPSPKNVSSWKKLCLEVTQSGEDEGDNCDTSEQKWIKLSLKIMMDKNGQMCVEQGKEC